MSIAKKISTENQNYASTKTTEGSYEALLKIDNACNFPLQKKLNLTRYCIAEPPLLRRNVPKFYTTKTTSHASAQI